MEDVLYEEEEEHVLGLASDGWHQSASISYSRTHMRKALGQSKGETQILYS